MAFYTIVIDFAGGTYISQVRATSPKAAGVKGVKSLDVSQIFGLGEKTKTSLVEQLQEDNPVPLNELTNVWCTTGYVNGKFVLINIVQSIE
jgi:hypothetical protein